jgi:hypothetical protein
MRPPRRVEVTLRGLGIRPRNAPCIGRESFVPDRPPVLAVRRRDVVAPDPPRRGEERKTHADGDLEQRALLALGSPAETGEE